MRFVLIIADGRSVASPPASAPDADHAAPQTQPEPSTSRLYDALDAAQTPAIDAMGRLGRVGAAATTTARGGSFEIGALALLGYAPDEIAMVSSAAVEAAAIGEPARSGTVLRVGLVSVSDDDRDGVLHACPHAWPNESTPAPATEIDAIFDDLIAHWQQSMPSTMQAVRFLGCGPTRLMIDLADPAGDTQAPHTKYAGIELVDPASVVGARWVEHLPDGGTAALGTRGSDFLCELITASRHFLADHPVNSARAEQGLLPLNLAWAWDAGSAGFLPDLHDRVTCPVSFVSDCTQGVGLAAIVGAPCSLSAADADLSTAILDALDSVDQDAGPSEDRMLVVITQRDIESVDTNIVEPLIRTLAGAPAAQLDHTDDADWRVLVAVSHDPQGIAGVAGGLAPFVLAGGRVRSVVDRRLSGALGSDLLIDQAHELLEYVLRAGLRGVRR